jgi:hypothetical protein
MVNSIALNNNIIIWTTALRGVLSIAQKHFFSKSNHIKLSFKGSI